jgi:transcriptional regulator
MSLTEVFQIASKFIDIKPYNIKRETLIGEAKLQHGVAYYIHDEEKMKEQINTLMQGKYFVEEDVQTAGITEKKDENSQQGEVKSQSNNKNKETPKTPYVVVLNGVGSQGLAQRAKDLLYVNNIDVQDTSNADNFDYTQTYIYYKDDASLADNVQSILGTGTIVQENKAYLGKATDILVVIGSDFKK